MHSLVQTMIYDDVRTTLEVVYQHWGFHFINLDCEKSVNFLAHGFKLCVKCVTIQMKKYQLLSSYMLLLNNSVSYYLVYSLYRQFLLTL